MKSVIFYIGALCLVVNVLCCLVLSIYSPFNCLLTSGAILLNMCLMVLVSVVTLKVAFRISLNVLFPLFFVAEFVCGLFAPGQWNDNAYIIVMAIAMLIEGIILIVTHHISKNIQS